MNIKNLCKKSNLSFKTLSEKSGISLTYIYELERGSKTNPSMETILKLANALEVSISELLDESKEAI